MNDITKAERTIPFTAEECKTLLAACEYSLRCQVSYGDLVRIEAMKERLELIVRGSAR